MNLLAADSHSLGDFDAEEEEVGVEDIGGGGSESNFVRRRRVVLIDYFFLSVKAIKDRGKLNQKSNDIMRSILSPRSFHYFRESVQIFFQFCYFKILRSFGSKVFAFENPLPNRFINGHSQLLHFLQN